MYALSRSGTAPTTAARPAASAADASSALPVSTDSAARARHGTGATAPSTTDALVHVAPCRSSATATSTSGQSYDSFSACLP